MKRVQLVFAPSPWQDKDQCEVRVGWQALQESDYAKNLACMKLLLIPCLAAYSVSIDGLRADQGP